MRFSLVFLLAIPLVALATPQSPSPSSDRTKATKNNCAVSHCEPAKPPAAHQPHNLGTTISARNITSILDIDEPIVAKGGHGGGGHGSGSHGRPVVVGGGGSTSAASRSVSNPLSALRGPILVLNSLFEASGAQVWWGASLEQAAGNSQLVGKKML
jgi:hypothetical protein